MMMTPIHKYMYVIFMIPGVTVSDMEICHILELRTAYVIVECTTQTQTDRQILTRLS